VTTTHPKGGSNPQRDPQGTAPRWRRRHALSSQPFSSTERKSPMTQLDVTPRCWDVYTRRTVSSALRAYLAVGGVGRFDGCLACDVALWPLSANLAVEHLRPRLSWRGMRRIFVYHHDGWAICV